MKRRAAALAFTVPGVPVPCARARVVRRRPFERPRAITPARTEAYEQTVALYARVAMGAAHWTRRERRLVTEPKTYKVLLDVYRVARRGDIDNYAKGVLDGLTRAGVWTDDRLVDALVVRLFIDKKRPRVEVMVTEEGSS